MQLTKQLLAAAAAYRSARPMPPQFKPMSQSRLSTLLFNDGKRLDQIEAGRDLTTKVHEKAMQWLSDNWPEGAQWPEGITRPEKTKAVA